MSAEWMVPKALWLAECEAATYRSAALICEYQDWINLRLTGRLVGAANNMAVRWHWDEQRGEAGEEGGKGEGQGQLGWCRHRTACAAGGRGTKWVVTGREGGEGCS